MSSYLEELVRIKRELIIYRVDLLDYGFKSCSSEKEKVRGYASVVVELIDTADYLIGQGVNYLVEHKSDVDSFFDNYFKLVDLHKSIWKFDSDNA